nr:xylulose kinase-1 [Tanacetum cinerariifolium]
MNIWKVIQNGNSLKRIRKDPDERLIILPPTTAEEHIVVQRELKARTTLLQSIPDDHIAYFHYMDDARDIWNAVKARFGGNAESNKMRKFMLKSNEANTLGDAGEFALMGVTFEPERVRMGFSVFTITSEDVEGRPTFHSGIHLIKNCDFYEKQMANTTVGLGVGPAVRPQSVPTGKPTVTPVPTGKQKVKPVPTGKPHVFTPVPTGRPDRPLSVLTDRGYTPLVVLGNHIEKVYTGYLRTRVDLIHLHTDDNVADLLTKAFDEHRFNYLVVNIGMLNP